MIRVEPFSGEEEDWDTFAAQCPGYTHFHQYRWRHVIQRVFGHECIYLAARDGERLTGVLPLVRVRSFLFGHFLVSMPFVSYGGPLGTEQGIQALTDDATARALRDNVKLLELRARGPLPIALSASHRKITVLLDLAATADETFKKFGSNVRRQIQRGRKAGITVKFGRDQVEPFFAVFSRHMRDLGTPTQSAKFFRVIAETFPDDAWFAAAYFEGRPVAAACGFRFGSEFEVTWAASLREYNDKAANMFLYWSCIERAIASGLSTFNFGRCSRGGGTHRFKLQWGGREQQLWWYDQSPRTGAMTPSPNEGAFSWGPLIWRHIPTAVATAVGPQIVRYIP